MSSISVIIPTFNRAALLKSTLDSVLSQGFTDLEVIVVDDGSTDNTIDYLRSCDGRVKVLQQSNRGPGEARNLGARHANSRYLAFLDSDDLWFSWTLDVYRAVIERHNRPAFIVGKPHLFSDVSELSQVVHGDLRTNAFHDYLSSGDQWRWWGASSFVVDRNTFISAGTFTPEWVNGEDADLALRLGVAPAFIQIVEPATFAYRQHASSAMKNFKRTLAGAWMMVRAEQNELYPGGSARAMERRQILTRHVRPVTLDCLRAGLIQDGWNLYLATFAWNLALKRVRYIGGFLLAALSERLRHKTGSGNEAEGDVNS